MTGFAWLRQLHPFGHYTIVTPEVKPFIRFLENQTNFLTLNVADWFSGYCVSQLAVESFKLLFPNFSIAAFINFGRRSPSHPKVTDQFWFVAAPSFFFTKAMMSELESYGVTVTTECTGSQFIAEAALLPVGCITPWNVFCPFYARLGTISVRNFY